VKKEIDRRDQESHARGEAGRGEMTRLAEAIGCSTGTLSEMLESGQFSTYRSAIDAHYKIDTLFTLSPDQAEVLDVVAKLGDDVKDLLMELKRLPQHEAREKARSILKLIKR